MPIKHRRNRGGSMAGMDTRKDRKGFATDLVNTVALIGVLLAVYIAWRSFAGQDDGVLKLLGRLF